MLYGILLVVQVVVALGLIALVLIQHGKGADAGAAFGSGASSTVFGARGSANFLSRATAVLAALFFANSLGLAYMVSNQPTPTSVIDMMTPAPQVIEEQRPAPVERPVDEEADGPVDVPR
jgi:preprotein translocase subunit SecG